MSSWIENEDYYYNEQGLLVFTEKALTWIAGIAAARVAATVPMTTKKVPGTQALRAFSSIEGFMVTPKNNKTSIFHFSPSCRGLEKAGIFLRIRYFIRIYYFLRHFIRISLNYAVLYEFQPNTYICLDKRSTMPIHAVP